MDIWVIVDTHFGHIKLIDEGYRVPENDSRIVNQLRQFPEDSVLIHLGDVCIGNDRGIHKHYIQPLQTTKILVRGNHDHKSNTWYLNNGWDFVCRQFRDKLFGADIVFSHEAIPSDGTFDLNIHGHNHDLTKGHRTYTYKFSPNHLLLAIETNLNYSPVTLKNIVQKMWKK